MSINPVKLNYFKNPIKPSFKGLAEDAKAMDDETKD